MYYFDIQLFMHANIFHNFLSNTKSFVFRILFCCDYMLENEKFHLKLHT